MNLSERIKFIRKSFGINQEKLADILGTSLGVPKGLENGSIMAIKPKYSLVLSNRFNISKEWIESGIGDMYIDDNIPSEEELKLLSNALNDKKITVPYYEDIRASAGNGCINGECTPSSIAILPKLIYAKSKNVEAIRVSGDSMTGSIEDGDIIFFGKNYTEIINGRIYVVVLGDEVYVKRIFKAPNTPRLILKSDNPVYPQFEAIEDEFKIIGKVIANMRIKEL